MKPQSEKRLTFLMVLPGLLMAVAVLAADEPAGFAEVKWGTPRDDTKQALLGRCKVEWDKSPPLRTERCGVYGIGVVFGRLTLTFDTVGLAAYRFEFSQAYPMFRGIAIERFGSSFERETKAYVTGRGLSVEGERLTWAWPNVLASLEERCGRLTESCLVVSTKAHADEMVRRLRQLEEKAKKDF